MSSFLIAIDPGTCAGLAVFRDDVLIHASAQQGGTSVAEIDDQAAAIASTIKQMRTGSAGFGKVAEIVIERPQIYKGPLQKGDPNDLTPLALLAGCLFARLGYGDQRWIYPREWKGQLDKDVCAARVQNALSEVETVVLAEGLKKLRKTLHHNVLDAVGLGLWALGRFEPKKIIAR